MQTENLTWEQAKNMLATGLTPYVEFMEKYRLHDYYSYAGGGLFASHFHGGNTGTREYPFSGDSAHYRFRAVSKPTHP